METSDRVRLARRRGKMTQSQLAATVRVARSAVAQWEQANGPRPTNEHMAQIAVCCNVCYEWLATGRGPITADIKDPGALALDIELHLYARDDLEKRLLTSFRKIEYPGNQALVELVETLMRRKAWAYASTDTVSARKSKLASLAESDDVGDDRHDFGKNKPKKLPGLNMA